MNRLIKAFRYCLEDKHFVTIISPSIKQEKWNHKHNPAHSVVHESKECEVTVHIIILHHKGLHHWLSGEELVKSV